MKTEMRSIGRENAIALAKTNWWKDMRPENIVMIQLFTAELCMDFGDFQEAVEKCLKRPVFTHEFGMNYDGIVKEFLGEKEAPTLEEIINLVPKDKAIIVFKE